MRLQIYFGIFEFENQNDVGTFFRSLEDFNPKYVLIVTQNWRNPGTLLHYLYHKIFGKVWNHGNLTKMTIKPIEEYSRISKKYEILEEGLFDAPWFILDVYEVGRYLRNLYQNQNSLLNKRKQACLKFRRTS